MTPELRKMAEEAGICITVQMGVVEMLGKETLEAFARLVAKSAFMDGWWHHYTQSTGATICETREIEIAEAVAARKYAPKS